MHFELSRQYIRSADHVVTILNGKSDRCIGWSAADMYKNSTLGSGSSGYQNTSGWWQLVTCPGLDTWAGHSQTGSRSEDPLTAGAEYQYRIQHARGDWNAGVECEIRVTADAKNFYVKGEYRAIEINGWSNAVPLTGHFNEISFEFGVQNFYTNQQRM